jgi:hypothetical protein
MTHLPGFPFNKAGARAFARFLGILPRGFLDGSGPAAPRPRPGRRKARRMAARGY